jgi:CD109 antigen
MLMYFIQGLGGYVSLAQSRAVQWLERNIRLVADHGKPYEVAVVAYALLVSKSSVAESAFGILARHARIDGKFTDITLVTYSSNMLCITGGLMYWGRDPVPLPPFKLENQKPFLLPRLPYKYDSENIEATSWALLTYVSRQEIMVDPIVKWLNSQRLYDGGWASTQVNRLC